MTLRPSEGFEWKFNPARGVQIWYSWSTEGGAVDCEIHGTRAAFGGELSYKSGRVVARDEGVHTAVFDGTHGWFFRNRGNQPVKITLITSGAYTDLKRMERVRRGDQSTVAAPRLPI